jgi:hypothetical protein
MSREMRPIRECLPDLLELFRERTYVTSRQIANITGDYQGADAVTRCRAFGMDIETWGLADYSRQRRTYRLNDIDQWGEIERQYGSTK